MSMFSKSILTALTVLLFSLSQPATADQNCGYSDAMIKAEATAKANPDKPFPMSLKDVMAWRGAYCSDFAKGEYIKATLFTYEETKALIEQLGEKSTAIKTFLQDNRRGYPMAIYYYSQIYIINWEHFISFAQDQEFFDLVEAISRNYLISRDLSGLSVDEWTAADKAGVALPGCKDGTYSADTCLAIRLGSGILPVKSFLTDSFQQKLWEYDYMHKVHKMMVWVSNQNTYIIKKTLNTIWARENEYPTD